MRILLVSPVLPHLPSHDAARLAPAQLIEHLGSRHTLGVVAATTGGDTPTARAWLATRAAWLETLPAQRWRHAVSGRPAAGLRTMAAAARRAMGAFRPDVVHVESPLLAPIARAAGVPTVLACHESPALRARAAARPSAPAWRRVRARLDERVEAEWERDWFAGLGACVVESEEDRRAIAAHLSFDRIDVIPAGIDAEQYAYRRRGEPGRVVFTGHLGVPRDAEAARRVATAIVPLLRGRVPRAELLLASPDSAAPARDLAAVPGVRVEGSLADLRPSVWSASVFVSPLDAGFGRKARILEALALGTPVVASAASLSGLDDVLPGHHVLTAETDADFADAVALLMREPVVATTIARNARQLVERRFTWRAIAARYDALYARLAGVPAERAA
ncbi:MAG TPA: glycosyltransferase family 4 protein [Methylomirabilota bacterium]|nr:glycosyltransferase family 4 protein [Methylomirabilota bacterium]